MTEGPSRAPARAMLRAIGFSREDLGQPIIGVGHSWIETMPCNYNHRALAEQVKAGIRAAGGTPMEFNTIAVSDGVTMGTEGMKASLVSREVIADSIELVARGHSFDGLVLIVGCDKTIPAAAMALARLDLPGLVLYGGTIAPGRLRERDLTVQDVFEAVGAHAAGRIDDAELPRWRRRPAPEPAPAAASTPPTPWHGAGVPRDQSRRAATTSPPPHPAKARGRGRAPGGWPCELVRDDARPRTIVTRAAFENAIAASPPPAAPPTRCCTCSPSPRRRTCPSTIDDFDRDLRRAPRHRRPQARRPLRRRRPARAPAASACSPSGCSQPGLLHDGCAHRRRAHPRRDRRRRDETPGQQVIRPLDAPLKARGGIAILHGNLAPEGCVVKLAGHERTHHRGPARVFDCEEAAFAAVQARTIRAGDVVVIRYEGPVGGPGMREMLAVTGAIVGAGLGDSRGADHRRPVLRRHPRLHGRPRRPRGGPAAARSPRCATATRSPSTSTPRRIDVEVERRRAGASACAAGRPRRRATRTGRSPSTPRRLDRRRSARSRRPSPRPATPPQTFRRGRAHTREPAVNGFVTERGLTVRPIVS